MPKKPIGGTYCTEFSNSMKHIPGLFKDHHHFQVLSMTMGTLSLALKNDTKTRNNNHRNIQQTQKYRTQVNMHYERLSWPGWLTCSGWFAHYSGHPSAVSWAWDRESSLARDRCPTTVPSNEPSSASIYTMKPTIETNTTVVLSVVWTRFVTIQGRRYRRRRPI